MAHSNDILSVDWSGYLADLPVKRLRLEAVVGELIADGLEG
jgi:hypothetical protein